VNGGSGIILARIWPFNNAINSACVLGFFGFH
jgi:hypothetical protein